MLALAATQAWSRVHGGHERRVISAQDRGEPQAIEQHRSVKHDRGGHRGAQGRRTYPLPAARLHKAVRREGSIEQERRDEAGGVATPQEYRTDDVREDVEPNRGLKGKQTPEQTRRMKFPVDRYRERERADR